MGALNTVAADRAARWSAEGRARADGVRAAHRLAHGTRAIRTHLDSLPPQDAISFPVFRELRADWAGRIDLQASCLVGIDRMEPDGDFRATADIVAASGGVLGMVTYPIPDLKARLLDLLPARVAAGPVGDFHVDETGDPVALRVIAETVLETGFDAPVVVGHCCSLAVQDEAEAMRDARPRREGGAARREPADVQPLSPGPHGAPHPALARHHAGPRDEGARHQRELRLGQHPRPVLRLWRPRHARGDAQATRIAHLDHSTDDWSHAFVTNPARACGFDAPSLAPGAPADLVICRAREWTELFSRPQSDRIVLRAGRAIDRTLPDYAELDDLMRTA
jgi:cytosine/creatinine deaminase